MELVQLPKFEKRQSSGHGSLVHEGVRVARLRLADVGARPAVDCAGTTTKRMRVDTPPPHPALHSLQLLQFAVVQ